EPDFITARLKDKSPEVDSPNTVMASIGGFGTTRAMLVGPSYSVVPTLKLHHKSVAAAPGSQTTWKVHVPVVPLSVTSKVPSAAGVPLPVSVSVCVPTVRVAEPAKVIPFAVPVRDTTPAVVTFTSTSTVL